MEKIGNCDKFSGKKIMVYVKPHEDQIMDNFIRLYRFMKMTVPLA